MADGITPWSSALACCGLDSRLGDAAESCERRASIFGCFLSHCGELHMKTRLAEFPRSPEADTILKEDAFLPGRSFVESAAERLWTPSTGLRQRSPAGLRDGVREAAGSNESCRKKTGPIFFLPVVPVFLVGAQGALDLTGAVPACCAVERSGGIGFFLPCRASPTVVQVRLHSRICPSQWPRHGFESVTTSQATCYKVCVCVCVCVCACQRSKTALRLVGCCQVQSPLQCARGRHNQLEAHPSVKLRAFGP